MEALIHETLEVHNRLRQAHGAPPLVWNEHAYGHAKKAAKECAKRGKMEHCHCKDHGQNLYMASTAVSITRAIETWYKEVERYDWSAPGFVKGTGHFTQVVWRDTKTVGLHVETTPEGVFWVAANYGPAGNMQGKFQANVLPLQGPAPVLSEAGKALPVTTTRRTRTTTRTRSGTTTIVQETSDQSGKSRTSSTTSHSRKHQTAPVTPVTRVAPVVVPVTHAAPVVIASKPASKNSRKKTPLPPGVVERTRKDGTVIRTALDGTCIKYRPNGSVTQTFLDGSRVLTAADGYVCKTLKDGMKIHTDPATGIRHTVYPDGHCVQSNPDGSSVQIGRDGSCVFIGPRGERHALVQCRDGVYRRAKSRGQV